MGGKILDAQLASFMEQAGSLGSGPNPHAAGVVRVGGNRNQVAASQPGHNAAHGGWLDLLGGGQFPQSFRSSENQHGERRKAGRPFASGYILLAQTTQQVDGGGMQPVGNRKDVGRGREFGLGHLVSIGGHFSLDAARQNIVSYAN